MNAEKHSRAIETEQESLACRVLPAWNGTYIMSCRRSVGSGSRRLCCTFGFDAICLSRRRRSRRTPAAFLGGKRWNWGVGDARSV